MFVEYSFLESKIIALQIRTNWFLISYVISIFDLDVQ